MIRRKHPTIQRRKLPTAQPVEKGNQWGIRLVPDACCLCKYGDLEMLPRCVKCIVGGGKQEFQSSKRALEKFSLWIKPPKAREDEGNDQPKYRRGRNG